MTAPVDFLDLSFDPLTLGEVEAWLAARDADTPFGYVVTPNVDHMVKMPTAEIEMRRAFADATLRVCDSRVLSRLARFAGVRLPVVPGSDLTVATLSHVLRAGDRVCLVGGSAADAGKLRALFPDIDLVHREAPMGLRRDAAARQAVAAEAAAARARLILLAVGSPQQEMIAWTIAQSPTARGTALCIGASVDFLIENQSRAPRVVQRAGFEWAWRLATSPRRLARRYLVEGPAIFPMVWRWRQAQRRIGGAQ